MSIEGVDCEFASELMVAGARFMRLEGLRVVLACRSGVLGKGAAFVAGLALPAVGAAPTPHDAAKSMATTPLYFRACKKVFMGLPWAMARLACTCS